MSMSMLCICMCTRSTQSLDEYWIALPQSVAAANEARDDGGRLRNDERWQRGVKGWRLAPANAPRGIGSANRVNAVGACESREEGREEGHTWRV